MGAMTWAHSMSSDTSISQVLLPVLLDGPEGIGGYIIRIAVNAAYRVAVLVQLLERRPVAGVELRQIEVGREGVDRPRGRWDRRRRR